MIQEYFLKTYFLGMLNHNINHKGKIMEKGQELTLVSNRSLKSLISFNLQNHSVSLSLPCKIKNVEGRGSQR